MGERHASFRHNCHSEYAFFSQMYGLLVLRYVEVSSACHALLLSVAVRVTTAAGRVLLSTVWIGASLEAGDDRLDGRGGGGSRRLVGSISP